MYDVLCFGSAVLDVLLKSDDFKVMKSHEVEGGVAICEVWGGKTEVDEMVMSAGGGAINSSISLGLKGLKAAPVCKFSKDLAGGVLLEVLSKYKISKEMMIVDSEGKTGTSVVLISKDGGRSIMTYRGSASEISSIEVNWQIAGFSKWFYISSMGGNWNLIEDVINFAKGKNIKVFFNPGRKELALKEKMKWAFERCEIIMMNKSEFCGLFDLNFSENKEIEQKALSVVRNKLLITNGKEGSVLFCDDKKYEADAFLTKSVDDTGAGDAFGSGLLYALISGFDWVKALKLAAANAASVVTKIGAIEGLLDEKSLLEWDKKNLTITERSIGKSGV